VLSFSYQLNNSFTPCPKDVLRSSVSNAIFPFYSDTLLGQNVLNDVLHLSSSRDVINHVTIRFTVTRTCRPIRYEPKRAKWPFKVIRGPMVVQMLNSVPFNVFHWTDNI